MAVRANSPLRDLADLIATAKAQPGKLTYGSGGVGTGNHLGAELLKRMAGIDLLHVPFRGISVAITALYSGDINMVVTNAIEALAQARDGRVRVLGVGGQQRIPESPDVPHDRRTGAGLRDDQLVPSWPARAAGERAVAARGRDRQDARRSEPGAARRRSRDDDDHVAARRAAAGMAAEVPRWKQLVPEIGIKTE